MPVYTPHEQYDRYIREWHKMRDVMEGQVAIHNKSTKYLPKLSGQTNEEYKAYMERATFFEASGRVLDGLSGMIFRKPPMIEQGQMRDEFIDDISLDDTSLVGFAKKCVEHVLTVGRYFILVDFPRAGDVLTQAQASTIRPFFKPYKAESVINWKTTYINNTFQLSEVRIKEMVEVPVNQFDVQEIEQIRVLILDPVYRQEIWQKSKEGSRDEWIKVEDIAITVNGGSIDYIPAVFINVQSTSPDIEKPPLLGLANQNISHYKTTADYEHGCHFTALPTAVITGHTIEEGQSFQIGSTTAWVFQNPDTKAQYLEFEGKGLDTLKEALSEKEERMAALGAQMLTPSTRRNEAAETSAIRHTGENSILADIAMTISEGLNKALSIMGEFMNVEPATIELNTDFMPQGMTPQMLTALVSSWQSGAISSQTLFENLKAGEIIDSMKQFDDEQDEIQGQGLTIDAS